MKHRFAGALLLCAALVGLVGTSAAASPDKDQIWVTSALVKRLGGVSVVGQVSCAGSYAQLVNGDLQYLDGDEETGVWTNIPALGSTDQVIMLVNADNYTVSQPAGRKTMIQVTHESSRMSPCYATTSSLPDGSVIPQSVACATSGTPCRWTTDAGDYDHDTYGPLFDYSPNGRFKAGLMAVRATPVGLVVMVLHDGGSVDYYTNPYGFAAMVSTTITAVNYR